MKNMTTRFALFAFLLAIFSACETKVDLNAPYKSYTTVYGLLDLSADTQLVRINKSFLGEGSALDFAMVPDSNEYNPDDVEAYIEWGNNVVQLQPHIVPNREPGVFYDEDIMVFITDEDLILNATGTPIDLNAQFGQLVPEYKLVVKVLGKEITGTSAPVYFRVNNLSDPTGGSSSIAWALNNTSFLNKKMTIIPVPVGVRYEGSIIFHYRAYLTNGEVEDRSFEFSVGGQEVPLGSGEGQGFNLNYSPESIFTFIANNVECGGSVAYREVQDVEFVVDVAGEDLTRYMTINNPVTGVVTDRPEFSNVEGEDAIGIFSSRFKFRTFKELNSTSREALHNGEITGQLCFCDPSPGSVFPCPPVNTPCPCE